MSYYLFDWTKNPPFTNHPEFRGKLRYGNHNLVTLNGKAMGPFVKKFMTGKRGWVEKSVSFLDKNGCPVEENGNLKTERLYGHVEFKESETSA